MPKLRDQKFKFSAHDEKTYVLNNCINGEANPSKYVLSPLSLSQTYSNIFTYFFFLNSHSSIHLLRLFPAVSSAQTQANLVYP